ncbi:MAG TPA: flagellar assembly protein FliH [Rhodocyclaceae bacterium]
MSTKKSMTAWERWELASLADGGAAPSKVPLKVPEPAPQLPTAEEIAQIRQEAWQAGHQEGHQAGHKEGLVAGEKAGRAEGEQAAQRLLAISARLDEELGQLDEAVADELANLALAVAREVLRQTIAVKPETVVAVVRDALRQLPHQHANIFLHPSDASLVRSYAGDQLSHAGHRIQDDDKLKRGDVVIEAGGAHLDATVASRWRLVLETLGREVPWFEGDEP